MVAEFGKRLRGYRIEAGKTQAELARAIGLSTEGYISKLEAGRKMPSLDLVIRLADALGVALDLLLIAPPTGSRQPQPIYEQSTSPSGTSGTQITGRASQAEHVQLFGAKLRRLREQHELTQQQLAHQLGYASAAYISSLESGLKVPSLEVVLRVANFFDVTTDYLVRDAIVTDSSRRTGR